MFFLPYAGNKVRLRKLCAADLDSFQSYRNDPEVARYQGWSPEPAQKAAAFLAKMESAEALRIDEWFQFGIADLASGVLLGDIGIVLRRAGGLVAEIGISLSRQAQGHGFASDAYQATAGLLFEQTSIDRIESITDTRNIRCIRLLERAGLRHLRTISSTFRGAPCKEHVFGMTRERWPAKPPHP